MASSLWALLDDITTLLDDVSVMTKVAAKKTAGVLGDDLALNAEQVAGVLAERELPVVWSVAKGSFVNKLILVPSALGISAVLPSAITPLLMLGGLYLCFEGFEKIAHKFLHAPEEETAHHKELVKAVANPAVDMVAFEKEKIKGAIRTDFILSAEIVVIALGTVAQETFLKQVMVISGIALVMTVGVYGLVAGIVKLDDAGFYLRKKSQVVLKSLGSSLLFIAPYLMKSLSVIGTAAMFLVGGGILSHGIHAIDDFAKGLAEQAGLFGSLAPTLIHFFVGIVAGALVLLVVSLSGRAIAKFKK
ncbi:MAG: DUF808 domain-containing protein [Pseudobdellovibrionaceae bacterium]